MPEARGSSLELRLDFSPPVTHVKKTYRILTYFYRQSSRRQNCLNTREFEDLVILGTSDDPIESFDTSDIYDFSHSKRGCAVLIMNHEFADPDENLPVVKYDIDSMSKLFSSLGFDVKLLINLTQDQLLLDLPSKYMYIAKDATEVANNLQMFMRYMLNLRRNSNNSLYNYSNYSYKLNYMPYTRQYSPRFINTETKPKFQDNEVLVILHTLKTICIVYV